MAVSRPHALREYTGYPTVDSGDKPSSASGVGIQGVSKVMARIVARGGDHDGVGGTEVSSGSEEVPPKCVLKQCKHIGPAQGEFKFPLKLKRSAETGLLSRLQSLTGEYS